MIQKLVVQAGRTRRVRLHFGADHLLVIECAAAQSPEVPLPSSAPVALAVHPGHYATSAAELVALALERSACERTEWRLRPSIAPRVGDPVDWPAIEASVRTKFGRAKRGPSLM